MKQELTKEIELTATPTAFTIDVSGPESFCRVYSTGSVTIGGTSSIGATGTPIEGHRAIIEYVATIAGGTLTFFGVGALRAEWLSRVVRIEAYYNGSAWELTFLPDLSRNGTLDPDVLISIPEDKISYNATSVSTINAAGEQELRSLTIPANTFDTAGQAFRLIAWGTTTSTAAELKTITVKTVTGATTNTVYTNAVNTDIVGNWRLDVLVTITNTGTGEIQVMGDLKALVDASTADPDVYAPAAKPTGYDPTVAQYVKIYGTETTPSGGQITLLGARLMRA